MSIITYKSEAEFIGSKTKIEERVAAIDALIDAMLLTAASAATNNDISEYWLNDGQTQIKTIYRNSAQIMDGIKALEQIKTRYMNNSAGRMTRLMDTKNFRNGC